MKVLTGSSVEKVDTDGKLCKVTIKTPKGEEVHEAEIVLSAVGITPNLENIGIEELGIELDKGRVKVDTYYRTNVKGVYAIGDIINVITSYSIHYTKLYESFPINLHAGSTVIEFIEVLFCQWF